MNIKNVIARSVSDEAISSNPGIASSLTLLAMTELNISAVGVAEEHDRVIYFTVIIP